MASLSTDAKGNQRILYLHPADGKRKTLYVGKMASAAAADKFLAHLETLLAYLRTGEPFGPKTVEWIASLPPALAGKLADAELIPPRPGERAAPTLDDYISRYLDSLPHLKKTARTARRVSLNQGALHIGKARRLNEVDERIAAGMVRDMTIAEYSKATISKAVIVMRAMFKSAMRQRLTDRNPFEFLKPGSQSNQSRKQFIPADTVRQLIDTLPGTEWPLLVALARWGGLRTPSEPFGMVWDHVLWDKNRLIIPVPKMEHLPGHETRVIPIFPEIRPYLDAAWDAADDGDVFLFPRLRKLAGISTLLHKRIVAAGLTPWPRTWQNLRASRATELADRFPSHVAAAWLGHSETIADRHYRSVLDSHFDDALTTTQIPTQKRPEMGENERTAVPTRNAKNAGNTEKIDVSREIKVTLTGFEPVSRP